MTGRRINRLAGCGTNAFTDRFHRWTLPRQDPTDLIFARKALDCRRFDDAERHLRHALDIEFAIGRSAELDGCPTRASG